jgi:hypothetical protein
MTPTSMYNNQEHYDLTFMYNNLENYDPTFMAIIHFQCFIESTKQSTSSIIVYKQV